MRYGYYHSYNNYISNYHLGYTLAQNARLLSEANYFESGYELLVLETRITQHVIYPLSDALKEVNSLALELVEK